jgi:hypothetical protein
MFSDAFLIQNHLKQGNAFDKVFYPDDDDDRDGHRNVGIQRTPNAADSLRRLYQGSNIIWN